MVRSRFGQVCSCCSINVLPGFLVSMFAHHFVHLYRCHLHCKTNVGCATGGAFASSASDSKIGYLLGSTRVCQKSCRRSVGWRELWPHRSLRPFGSLLCQPVPSSPSKDAEGRDDDGMRSDSTKTFWDIHKGHPH